MYSSPNEEFFDDMKIKEVAVNNDGKDDEKAEPPTPIYVAPGGQMKVDCINKVGIVCGY